jgi:hypothetical protein
LATRSPPPRRSRFHALRSLWSRAPYAARLRIFRSSSARADSRGLESHRDPSRLSCVSTLSHGSRRPRRLIRS